MKFSLFVHMERTDPAIPHARLFAELEELALTAEGAGFETVWIGEHHAMDFTIAPNPFIQLAHLAAKTKTIRLGTGNVIAPFWHPIRLAGEAAMMDIACDGRLDLGVVARRIATFPPFYAVLIAFATNHLARPEWLAQLIEILANTLTPIALAAVGFALRLDRLAGRTGPVALGLCHRLIVAPALLIGFYLALGQAGDPVAKVAMLEMAMPPMLGASIIAMDHDLEPDLVALLIGLGVPLSLLTAWGWWTLIAPLT
ncbi:MAG: LLM class flavin-dependent oxidoreductase [Starkeya sp.]|nr:LLM class flavin-dependent oxidoreductase [Starkeya sp.]